MKLYSMFEGGYRPGGYAFASGYGPIDDLWFLNAKFLDRRRAYWKVNPEPPGLSIEPNAKSWPDFLGNGHSPPMFFVSERVVESLLRFGASLGRRTEMPIAEINAKALKSKPPPRYFVVETIPGLEVDLVATGFKLDAVGKAIVTPPPNPWPTPYHYRASSWNGSDLFSYRHFGPTDGPYTEMFCAERVKDLAQGEGWTNVRFVPLATT